MAEEHGSVVGVPGTGAVLADRYRLVRRVGRGGMAVVYAAEDQVLRREVAVKVFQFDTTAGDDQRRVDAEIGTLASLRHPGLVMVLDAGSVPEPGGQATPFIVMELISGPTLAQRIAERPLTPEEAAVLGEDLAVTLAYIHRQGIVHRDIKPANVLLDAPAAATRSFSAKLTDFGVARLLDSTRLTAHGMTIGTANYLSPEQATTGEVGPPSDIYSFGLVLIECLSGRLAYPGVGIEAAVARLYRAPAISPDLGPGWTHLLTAMTARDPADRPTAEESADMLRALDPAPVEASTVTSPTAATEIITGPDSGARSTRVLNTPAGPGPVELSLRRRRLRFGAAGLAIIALGVLIAILVGSHGSGPSTPPAPTYPSVPGQLGSDLHTLESAIG